MTRTSTALGLTAGLTASVAWVGLSAGSANADSTYDALARTDVSTVTISNQSIPTGIAIEGGGPVARVHQDSLGTRDANAALPYAGDTVAGLPGLGASLFGFPAPAYPFVASSTAGTPPQTIAYPGMSLEADSGDLTTTARSTAGEAGAGASAAADVLEEKAGNVIATANTTVDTIKLGPYGSLSNVRTSAIVSADGTTGQLTRSTTSSIGRISIPGLTFTVPKQSPSAIPIPIPIPGVPNQDPIPAPPFAYPGAGTTFTDPDLGVQDGYFTVTVPGEQGPQKYAVPTQPVLDALKQAGISLSFQAPQKTATGIIAGSYIVTYTIPAPPPNSYYTGPTKITQTTAYGLASVNLQAVTSDFTAVPTGTTPAGTTPAGVDAAAVPGLLPTTDLGAVPGAAVPTGVLAPTSDQLQLAAGFPLGKGIDALYLGLLGVAIAGLIGAAGVAWLGVRSS